MKITFRQIDAFKTLVLVGTVTESARLLGVSQPAVSRLISDLEEEVGFRLFKRSGRNLRATQEARLLIEEVRRALSGLEQIKKTAVAIKNYKHAQLRLITTPLFSTSIVPKLIQKFSTICPEAMVSLEIQSTDDTVEWMVSQNHDFGIAPSTVSNTTINSHPLFDTQSVCVLPKGHPLEKKKVISPKNLEDMSFISFMSDSTFRFDVDELFRKAGISRKLQYEARTTDAIYHLVESGLGVSIAGSANSALRSSRGISTVPFKPKLPFKVALIWSDKKPLSRVAEEFLKMVDEFSFD